MRLPKLKNLRPSFLKPDIILPSVRDLTAELLTERGIQCVVFDVDDTLTYHQGSRVDDATLNLLIELQRTSSIKLFIASNSRRDLTHIGSQLGAKVIRSTLLSRKPRRTHYRKIVRETGFKAHQIAMIGDRLLTDILGGNMAGMLTVLVLSRKTRLFNDHK